MLRLSGSSLIPITPKGAKFSVQCPLTSPFVLGGFCKLALLQPKTCKHGFRFSTTTGFPIISLGVKSAAPGIKSILVIKWNDNPKRSPIVSLSEIHHWVLKSTLGPKVIKWSPALDPKDDAPFGSSRFRIGSRSLVSQLERLAGGEAQEVADGPGTPSEKNNPWGEAPEVGPQPWRTTPNRL